MDVDIQTIHIAVTAVVMAAAVLLGNRWQHAKSRLTEIRQLVDTVDDALYDDRVSEEEFREIFQRLMHFIES
jgi:hypothetical protein